MTGPDDRRRAKGAETIQRLLDATASLLSSSGASGVSVQRVADAAGTSKGLVHYHFPDKEALLAACAGHLTSVIVATEAAVLERSTATSALDDLWRGFMATVRGGARRALMSLHTDATPATRAVLIASALRRRRAAEDMIASLETLLSFRSGVPRPALATAYVALADGLALDLFVRPTVDNRPAFDAFWLAVLTLDAG